MANSRSESGAAQNGNGWNSSAAAYLKRRDICPRCDAQLRQPEWCANCRADLTGWAAVEVVKQSELAAKAIDARQVAITALATLPFVATPPPPAPGVPVASSPIAAPAAAAAATATTVAPPQREGSQISVQSVLAVVGAALLAVAALVFTFGNHDLINFATRTTIIGITTGVFLLGALLLVRAKLRFSAEAIGALGMVFVALDIWAFSQSAPHQISPFVFAGVGTAFSALVLIAVASVVRLRTWLWLGLVGLAITPAWFGYAVNTHWSAIVGHLGVGLAALGAHELARRLEPRMKSRLRADHWALTVLQLIVVVVVVPQTFFTDLADFAGSGHSDWGNSGVLAAIAVLALLGTRYQLAQLWSFVVGAALGLAALNIVTTAFDTRFEDSGWVKPATQAALAAVVAVLAVLSRTGSRSARQQVSRILLLIGALSILGVGFLIEFFTGSQTYFVGLDNLPAPAWVWGLGLSLGLLATALGSFSIWALGPRKLMPRFAWAMVIVGECLAGLSLLTLAGWDLLATYAQVLIALGLAVGLSLIIAFVPALRRAPQSLRVPVLATIHLLVIEAVAITWADPLLSQIGGAGVVVTWVAVTIAMPRIIRPVHTAIGFAYALIVFAHVLQLAHLSDVAILSLTAALASATALIVTLFRKVPAGYWYGVLIVTAIPFLIGVVDVIFVRSGWTALSTGVTFALALTLVLTTRPGLSQYLRAVAAALLVPALAVVVIDLGAQFLVVSASPITLPIIAVIVACVLPSTELIGAALVRRGHSESDARLSRLWIEISTLVTAGLAVVLALVRAAAGLDTSFIVLIIIGIGAAATAVITHRRYGWIVAFASWTGALWSFWGRLGVHVLEPYLLPPAIAATLIGAIAVYRKLPGLGLYTVGLFCAAVPSLAVLAAAGNGGNIAWRTLGLIAGALVLVALGGLISERRTDSRVRSLATPTLLVGILAAAAGAIQAARVAVQSDLLWLHPHDPVMFVVLELSIVAAAIAALGARLLATPTRVESARWRWVYMPAILYLAIGPIYAVRPGWLSVWTLLALTIALLALMVATVIIASRRPVALPPVWFTFAVAWIVAVAGWSDRSLRVEAFSLPLGVALLLVGILAMRTPPEPGDRRNLNEWPLGFAGSWRLLAPGIIVTFLPSILATGTDPRTERAILVIAMALFAILIGSLRKFGAPFILGIVVLPLENGTVLLTQFGHTISATSWWITLASAGAVLLVIAVTYERRTGGGRGVAARIRDLK